MPSPLLIKDAGWVKQAFLVKAEDLQNYDLANRTFTSASLKFTDTSPGGNFGINPPPQFTRTADIKAGSKLTGSNGMGRFYSEAIDDNAQIIYMRFGVPAFNSLTTFFSGFYNTGAGQLARTGRAGGVFYQLGRAAGFVVAIMNWQLLAVQILGMGWKFFIGKPHSKFYYLKPTMPSYWNAVQTIVNQIAVNKGIVPRVGSKDANVKIGNNYEWDNNAREKFAKEMPTLFNSDGSVNVYALATRAMRLQHMQYKLMEQAFNGGSLDVFAAAQQVLGAKLKDKSVDYLTYLQKWTDNTPQGAPTAAQKASTAAADGSLASAAANAAQAAQAPNSAGTNASSAQANTTAAKTPPADATTESLSSLLEQQDSNFLTGMGSFLDAEMDDGSNFAAFRVNATGSVQESFSNSTAPSDIQQKINSMSSQSRSMNFNIAGGNLIGGAVGDIFGGVMGAVKSFASGAADSLGVSGLATLGGAAFVDIPEHWESSTADLPRANYTIQLTSPYGNPMSQMINIFIPMAMLLAAALPLSTGRQSYTSPFLCELYDRGRCQTRLGIVDQLSITRGTGNMGFTNEGHLMAVDISFSVKDLSSIMHMPISEGVNVGAAVAGGVAGAVAGGPIGAAIGAAVGALAAGTFDDDTYFSDYMALLGGMTLADQIYSWRRFKLNLTTTMTNWNTWFSRSHFASVLGNTPPARLFALWYKGVPR